MIRTKVLDADRLAVRHPPAGQPVMHQNWGKLLFTHWRIDESLLRPLVPSELQIDTYGDNAWIAVTPFTMWDIRFFPPYVPPVPGFNSMHELNVRTYVHYNGVPGVWFFSLDCNSAAAVFGARTLFHLPYHEAEIELEQNGNVIDYDLTRDEDPPAEFHASWSIGENLPVSQAGSREFFLTERYLLYTKHEDELYRARIYHQPWQLQKAELTQLETEMIQALGIPQPAGEPLVHYAEEVNVDIWMLESVYDSD
jgi:uncharacterized protein